MRRPATHWLFIFLLGLGGHDVESAAFAGSNNLPSGESRMSQTAKPPGDSGSDRPVQADDKNNVVITPAGPVPKDKVRRVGPGEMVRRNADGSHEVVPKNKEDKNEEK
jgi:hypothetical protein